MRKLIKTAFIFLYTFLLLISISKVNVLAAEVIFKVTNIEVKEKSAMVEVNEIGLNSGGIKNDIVFTNKGDYIKYDITIKNTSDKNFTIKSISDDNTSKYLKYTYDDLKDIKVNSGKEKTFELTITYKNESATTNITNGKVNLIITFEDEFGNKHTEGITTNPQTFDNILKYVILGFTSLTVLVICLLGKKKLSKTVITVMAFSLLIAPFNVDAQTGSLKIVFNNTIKAKKYTVTFNTSGGSTIESQIISYGKKVIKPENPTKENSSFENWYTDEAYTTVFDFDNTVVEKPLTIYAKWNEFPVSYKHTAACTFNGPGNTITGDDCEYKGEYYIDTNVALYSKDNYDLDYELGFVIERYDPAENIRQATMVNAKYENENKGWPGLVVRRSTRSNSLEISQTIHEERKTELFNPSNPTKVKIVRIGGIVYYSINDEIMVELQNINNTSDYFDTTTWFGASQNLDGSPQREFKGVLSNMYIKLGKYKSSNQIITFDPNGGIVSETTKTVESMQKIGDMPVPTHEDLQFSGWYTKKTGGTLVDDTSLVSSDITLYAHWEALAGACKINDEYYDTVQEAINDVTSDKTTIKVLKNVNEILSVPSGKNIELDLGGKSIINEQSTINYPVIENEGTLTVKNGTVSSNGKAAAINNQSGASLTLENMTVEATGIRQGLYNNGGVATIISSSIKSSTSERPALHIKSGDVKMLSGSIISSGYSAVEVESGTLTIGTKDNVYDNSSVIVKGEKYGINTSKNISIYDGTIKGIDDSINDENKITNTEDNGIIINETETIDSKTYKTLYYVIN